MSTDLHQVFDAHRESERSEPRPDHGEPSRETATLLEVVGHDDESGNVGHRHADAAERPRDNVHVDDGRRHRAGDEVHPQEGATAYSDDAAAVDVRQGAGHGTEQHG